MFRNFTTGPADAACQRYGSFDAPRHIVYLVAHEKNFFLKRTRLCRRENRQQEQRRIGRAAARRSVTNIDSEHAPAAPGIVCALIGRFNPKALAKYVLHSKTVDLNQCT